MSRAPVDRPSGRGPREWGLGWRVGFRRPQQSWSYRWGRDGAQRGRKETSDESGDSSCPQGQEGREGMQDLKARVPGVQRCHQRQTGEPSSPHAQSQAGPSATVLVPNTYTYTHTHTHTHTHSHSHMLVFTHTRLFIDTQAPKHTCLYTHHSSSPRLIRCRLR